jgi:hypothetical protein
LFFTLLADGSLELLAKIFCWPAIIYEMVIEFDRLRIFSGFVVVSGGFLDPWKVNAI